MFHYFIAPLSISRTNLSIFFKTNPFHSFSLAMTMNCQFRIVCVGDIYAERSINGRGGYSALAAMVDQARSELPNVRTFFFVTGDLLGGTTLCEVTHGAHIVEFLNIIKTDAVAVGNHEFDYGDVSFEQRVKESQFPWLAANITKLNEKTNERVPLDGVLKNKIFEVPVDGSDEPLKIGVFGVCTSATPYLSFPDKNTLFDDALFHAQEQADQLRQDGCDVVVALTHCKLSLDQAIVKKVKNIDILLGGHDHDSTVFLLPTEGVFGETLLLKPGMNAYWLAVIDMIVTKKSKDVPYQGVLSYAMRSNSALNKVPSSLSSIACDALLKKYDDERKIYLENAAKQVLISSLPKDLNMLTKDVRSCEANGASFVADSMKEWTNSDLAVINGGFIRGDKLYPKGSTITQADLNEQLPFPRPIVLIKIAGKHLKNAIEQLLVNTPAPNGSQPHVSENCVLTYNPKAEIGKKIVSFVVNNELLDEEKFYKCAITLFMLEGGDGVTSWAESTRLPTREVKLCQSVSEFARKYGDSVPIAEPNEGRIVIVE